MLARRGLKAHRTVPPERILPDLLDPAAPLDEWYRLLHRYSFRLLLRDVIRGKEGFALEDVGRYCSPRAARSYLTTLCQWGLVREYPAGTFRLARAGVTSFGETLEWFVAEIFRREFFAEAIHGVSFRRSPPGGDFDVVASVEGLLVHVETKSSPPRSIEAEEVEGFLRRREVLAPHLAFFFVDTHLRMGDKLATILDERIGGAPRDSGLPLRRVHRLEREIFHADHRVYLVNSARGILSNLRCCWVDCLRWHGKVFAGRPMERMDG